MPALVLLHAFPLDGGMWDTQVRALADAASPILAPSFPGFGGTPLPAPEPTLDDYADAVIASLDAAGIDRAAVLGCSMGGYVAFALWRRHRDRVAGLCLVDTKAEADAPEAAASRVRLAALVRERGVEALVRAPQRWLRDDSPHWPWLKERIRAQPAEAVAQATLAMSRRPDSRPDLATIDVPAAVIVGEDDTLTPLANARTMADGIAGASLSVIPDAAHLPSVEAPEAFAIAVRAWLRRVDG